MRDVRFAKLVLLVNGLVPLALLGWDVARGDLGANPIEFVLRSTGILALVFLTLSLGVTPVRQTFKLHWLVKLRRTLGLYAFFYACVHVCIYVVLDQFFDVRAILEDAIARPFITFGALAFGFMVPLAVTSTDAAVRRLGKRWGEIHRRVYLVAVLAVVHFYLESKADKTRPLVFAAVVGVLLFWRYVNRKERRI